MAQASAIRVPRSSGSGAPAAASVKRYTLEDISSSGSALPNRYGLHSIEGFGKSSLVTHAPRPIYMQSRGETGLETLIESGQVKPTPHFPACQNWDDVTAQVRFLINEEHSFKTLVFDALNGFERLLHEHVCTRDFGGDWGDKGFGGYMRGYDVSLADWRLFLNDLDTLRAKRKMIIFVLVHTKVKSFKNPMGADYDRYMPDMNEKTWGLTHKWLDAVFFGNFEVFVQTGNARGPVASDITRKGKGTGGNIRVLYTQRSAAYDAKNRLGLPEEIEMGSSSSEAWHNLTESIKLAKSQPVDQTTVDTPSTEGVGEEEPDTTENSTQDGEELLNG